MSNNLNHGSFRFDVELEALKVAGFAEVQGLEMETELEEYREGGVNDYVHRLPKVIRQSRIVLRKGLLSSPALWEWYSNSIQAASGIQRMSGSIILYKRSYKTAAKKTSASRGSDDDSVEFCRWNFFDAYPVKWVGPSFNAMNSDLAVEAIELVHNGLKFIKGKP